MKKYIIKGISEVEIVTCVEAESEEEALKEAADRDVNICIHGSELADKVVDEEEFTLTDGTHNGVDKLYVDSEE